MIGTLGNKIVFEVSDQKIQTFSDMSRNISGRWATHEVQGEKPRAEFLGAGLQSVELTIRLSAKWGVRPRAVLETIEQMVETGIAEYLVIGSRPVGKNPFRLTAASETWDTVYNKGELAAATLSLTLEEYV
jgi:hypothetical protein